MSSLPYSPQATATGSTAIATAHSRLVQRLEHLSRRGWFYLLIGLGPACFPPLTSSGLGYWRHLNDFIAHVSSTMLALSSRYDPYLPAMHVGILVLILLLIILRDRAARFFAFVVGVHFLFILWVQAIAWTPHYGLVIVSEPALWYLLTALMWFSEAIHPQTKYTFRAMRPGTLWLIPLAILAFWHPEEGSNYDLRLFLTSSSPLTFCMMTPIYLTVMRFQYPEVNLPLFRITAFMGIVLGIVSLGVTFFQPITEIPRWLLIHSPLLAISIHCFLLGMKQQPASRATCPQEQP